MSVTIYDHAPTDGAGASHMSTAEALRRLSQRRDSAAWSAVLHNHGLDILKLALRITGDSSLCEDVCQETLLQIRAHAGNFKPPQGLKDAEAAARGWVMCIAYRTAVGMLRVRERRSQNEEQARLAQHARAGSEHDPLLTSEQLAVVRSEIAGLPELLRSAVCLHFYGEMSFPELSTALECSEKAARKRVERGVQRLRTRLAGGGLALGAGALALALAGPGQTSALAGALSVSNALTVSRLAAWQALLHHPASPLLAGVAKAGGIAIMTKYVVGAAALLAFGLSGVQTFRLNTLSRELHEMREKAAVVAEHQDRLGALENQMAENRGDTAALKSSVTMGNQELARMEKKVTSMNPGSPYGYAANHLGGDVVHGMGLPPAPAANVNRGPVLWDKNIVNKPAEKVYPNLPPLPKNTVVKSLPNGVLQYETPEGKIMQQIAPPNYGKLPPADPAAKAPTAAPAADLPALAPEMVVKVLDDGIVQYETTDGRVIQRFQDTRLKALRTDPKAPPAAADKPAVFTAPVPVLGEIPNVGKLFTPATPPPAAVPVDPLTALPALTPPPATPVPGFPGQKDVKPPRASSTEKAVKPPRAPSTENF